MDTTIGISPVVARSENKDFLFGNNEKNCLFNETRIFLPQRIKHFDQRILHHRILLICEILMEVIFLFTLKRQIKDFYQRNQFCLKQRFSKIILFTKKSYSEKALRTPFLLHSMRTLMAIELHRQWVGIIICHLRPIQCFARTKFQFQRKMVCLLIARGFVGAPLGDERLPPNW